MRLSDDNKERLRAERALIIRGLERPETQLVFQKLDKAADEMLAHYDRQDFINKPAEAVYIQCFRDIVKKEIPRIFQNIINVDTPKDEPRWSFTAWLSSVLNKANILPRKAV